MIHIERNRIDENGNNIKPSDDWFEKAAYATNIAIEQRENHEADGNIYGSDEVRAALEKLFYDKCLIVSRKLVGHMIGMLSIFVQKAELPKGQTTIRVIIG